MTPADKLRELLATRPAMPNTEQLVSWWRTSAELLSQLLTEPKVLTTGRLDGLVISPILDDGEIRFLDFTVSTLPGLRLVLEASAARELREALGIILGNPAPQGDLRADLERERAAVDVLKQEVRELEQQRDALRTRLDIATNLDTRDAEIIRLRCQLEVADRNLDAARVAARAVMAQVEHLAAFADDSDPRVMATAGPLGVAQADLWLALGLSLDEEHARMQADIDSRCAVCGWPLAETREQGCVRGCCSLRPPPEKLYAPERAKREAEELHERALRNGMPPSGRWA